MVVSQNVMRYSHPLPLQYVPEHGPRATICNHQYSLRNIPENQAAAVDCLGFSNSYVRLCVGVRRLSELRDIEGVAALVCTYAGAPA